MKILLVEDEVHVASFINKGLGEEGYEMTIAMDGKIGWELFQQHNFDLIILDIMLPEINGLELCRLIRQKNSKVPILFLTALGTSENIVLGLNSGGDDYLVKPFKFIELTARIKSLLRRAENHTETKQKEDVYIIDDLVLNNTSKTVTRAGNPIVLTSTEYRLLLYLMQNKNRVMSRMEILENVWGVDFKLSTNVVDVYVNYLRNKADNTSNKLIHTVIGMGYVIKNK